MNAVAQHVNAPVEQPGLDTNLLNAVVRQKRDLKRALDAEAAAHNERAKRYKEQIAKIDAVLLRVLSDRMPTYRSIDAGTIGTTTSTKYNVKDRTKLEAWLREQNDFSYFSNALTKSVVDNYVTQHNALPPGVGAFVERKITHLTTTTS